jgi:hypothetical protein
MAGDFVESEDDVLALRAALLSLIDSLFRLSSANPPIDV